jgi:hypothetical protein
LVESELNGYSGPVPDYRMARGRPMSQHPLRGWPPIGGYIEQLSKRAVGEPFTAPDNPTPQTSGRRMGCRYPVG